MDAATWVLLLYIVLLLCIAWFVGKDEDIEGYVLNNRESGIWLMTLANFSTQVGAGATVGVVAEVYDTGISYGTAMIIQFLAGALILGGIAYRLRKDGEQFDVSNIAAWFGERYDARNETLVGFLQIVLATFWIGIQAVAFGSLVSVLTGIGFNLALGIASVATIVYTAIGGLKIDFVSDFIQFWIITTVFAAMAVLVWQDKGLTNMISQLPPGHLDLFAFGGPSWFVGAVLISGFVLVGNTAHWQRLLSAENPETARKSYWYTIPLLVVFGLLIVYVGLYGSMTMDVANQDQVIFALMDELLPGAIAGVGFAAILAIIMSSIDSLLIGGSTILYERYLENTVPGIGSARSVTAAFGTLGFLLAVLIPDIVTLGLFMAYLAVVFAPPVFAALFSPVTADASFSAILVGSIVLLVTFPTVGKNSFIVSTAASVALTFGYDTAEHLFKQW